MPAKSEAQRRLMEAVKHNPKVAARTGITPGQAGQVLGEHDAYLDAVKSGDSQRIRHAADSLTKGK